LNCKAWQIPTNSNEDSDLSFRSYRETCPKTWWKRCAKVWDEGVTPSEWDQNMPKHEYIHWYPLLDQSFSGVFIGRGKGLWALENGIYAFILRVYESMSARILVEGKGPAQENFGQ
jgi:hypothetical protein